MNKTLTMILLTMAFWLSGAASAAAQATFTVTKTADTNAACASGVNCSLREAVAAANAAATGDTINFAIPASDAGCAGGVCTITLTNGELQINSAATAGTLIIENTTGASNLRISGNNASRVFSVLAGANLTLTGVTVTNGAVAGNGGGILNTSATLVINNSIVSNNSTTSTSGAGGGIGSFGNSSTTLTVNNSTVSGNSATGFGGGIGSSVRLTMNNSTVSGNSSSSGNSGGSGGGIHNNGGIITLTGVTVAFNSSTSTTLTTSVGGINNQGGTANLTNTIVARNTVASSSTSPDFRNAIAPSSSFNLIGNGTGIIINTTSGITNGTNGNQVGTSAAPIDPLLAALAGNNGQTPTHALQTGSPAIDQGNATGTDQRGFTRPFDFPTIAPATGGNNADIGAFEVQMTMTTAASVSITGRALTADGRGIKNVVVQMTDGAGTTRAATTSAFGFYRFDDVAAGETYIITARGKRYWFSQPTQVVNALDETEINFVAYPSDRLK